MSIVRRNDSCEHCGVRFEYWLSGLSWDGLWCGYCERCGYAVVSGHKLRISDRRDLPACRCGGRFSSSAVPRCPSCGKELSRPWPPGACFVINDRVAFERPLGGGKVELVYP